MNEKEITIDGTVYIEKPAEPKPKKKGRFLKKVVQGLFVGIIIFILIMLWFFWKYQCVPDSLIVAVFTFATGEAWFTSLIKKSGM